MRAIIIDDEKHVREGIMLLAEWDKFHIEAVYEAQDGEEAIEKIKEFRPEIIFTDMRMPKKDGIEILKWLQENDSTSKTIVISGYDDYEYMRKAIHYGSFDYILKPIEPDVLNQTLEKAITDWKRDDQARKSRLEKNMVMNEVRPLYWDHMLTGLLNQPSSPKHILSKIEEEFSIETTHLECQLIVIQMHHILELEFRDQKELAYFSLLNICNEVLGGKRIGVGFRNLSTEGEIILILWKDLHECNKVLEEIYNSMLQFVRLPCIFGIGSKGRFSSDLLVSYETACKVLHKRNIMDTSKMKKIYSKADIVTYPLIHLFDYSQELQLAMQSGSINQLNVILSRIFEGTSLSNYISIEQIELWEKEFVILVNHWLKEYDVKSLPDMKQMVRNADMIRPFTFNSFKTDKMEAFYRVMQALQEQQHKKEKNVIYQIEEFIRIHYQQDIKLQEIADRFYLSREYISRKFKQEFNKNITDYLVKIRMENAKTLLRNPNLRIYEIANQIGYQDDKYFSKVFKKLEGLTPNEYRNKFGQY